MAAAQKKRPSASEWSDLTPDVLRLITLFLTNIWDYVRFRGVCSSWRLAADSPPQLPSLLLPYDLASESRSFLNLADRSVHTLHLPETRRKWIYGTQYGYLVMLGKEELADRYIFTVSLLNPITRSHILLPHLPAEFGLIPEVHLSDYRNLFHSSQPVLTAGPGPDTLLALLIDSDLAVCRMGVGGAWTMIKLGTPSAPHRHMLDLAYFDGAFYIVDDSKGITVVTRKTMKKRYSAPPQYSRSIPNSNSLFMVVSGGDLLLLEISMYGYDQSVKIMKLDRGGGSSGSRKLKWVDVVGSIGERVLFVSSGHSAVSQPSEGFMEGWGPDVVCFTTADKKDDAKYGEVHLGNVCISDIGRGKNFATKPYFWEHKWRPPTPRGRSLLGLTWIVPSLRHIESNGSLLLAGTQVPNVAIEDGNTSTEKDNTEEVDWAELPSDILLLISYKLGSLWDFVRFRGVCSSWRSTASARCRMPPQIPSLLLPYDLVTTTRSFFDISDSKVTTIDIPEARGKWLYGTPYGWLVMLGEEEKEDGWMFSVTLLNPITRAHILFPPLPREIANLPEQQIGGSSNCSSKPLLTGNPASPQEVLLGLLVLSRLVFCKLGQGEVWTVIDLLIPSAPRRRMADFTYFDGAFYVVDLSKGITVIRTNPVKRKYSTPSSTRAIRDYHTLHLVELSGDLLLLEMHKIKPGIVIEVEKLDRSTKKFKWARVEGNLNPGALFVSQNHSAISLCPQNSAMTGGGFLCLATDESKSDGKFGHVDMATVIMSLVESGVALGREPYYWQGSRRASTYGRNYNGLSWIMASPC